MQLTKACLWVRSVQCIWVAFTIHVVSRVKCGVKFVTAAFQSIALVQAHRGSKLDSIGIVIPIVAVTKKWSLPAIGPQYDCPQRHLSASWTSKSVTVMLRLWTNRSIVCTLCVRLLHAMFASSRSCVFNIYF